MRSQNRIVVSLAILAAAGLGLLRCRNDKGVDAASNNVAATANAANAGEIQLGQLARVRATVKDVKAFATQMVIAHTATLQRQSALFARLGIVPTENATSMQLRDEARVMLDNLQAQSAGAFDLAYMDGQVTMHTRLLALLDTDLIPGTRNPDFQDELRDLRSDVANHLQAAQALRARLSAGADLGTGDAGTGDGGAWDGGTGDGGGRDGGGRDGGIRDGGERDGGIRDGGERDGGERDGGARDAGARDGGERDGGIRDGGVRDGGARDGGATDGGPLDIGAARG